MLQCSHSTSGIVGEPPRKWLARNAQVAEWLMAADCKSAAPCELRRFESSPVHHDWELVGASVEKPKRLSVALGLYGALGLLVWFTISDLPLRLGGVRISLRALTIAILVIFAVRTLVY